MILFLFLCILCKYGSSKGCQQLTSQISNLFIDSLYVDHFYPVVDEYFQEDLGNWFEGNSLDYKVNSSIFTTTDKQKTMFVGEIQGLQEVVDVAYQSSRGFWTNQFALLGKIQNNFFILKIGSFNNTNIKFDSFELNFTGIQKHAPIYIIQEPNISCFNTAFMNPQFLIINCGIQHSDYFEDYLGVLNLENLQFYNQSFPNYQNYTTVNNSVVQTYLLSEGNKTFNNVSGKYYLNNFLIFSGTISRSFLTGQFQPSNKNTSIDIFNFTFSNNYINITQVSTFNSSDQIIQTQLTNNGYLFVLHPMQLSVFSVFDSNLKFVRTVNTTNELMYNLAFTVNVITQKLTGKIGTIFILTSPIDKNQQEKECDNCYLHQIYGFALNFFSDVFEFQGFLQVFIPNQIIVQKAQFLQMSSNSQYILLNTGYNYCLWEYNLPLKFKFWGYLANDYFKEIWHFTQYSGLATLNANNNNLLTFNNKNSQILTLQKPFLVTNTSTPTNQLQELVVQAYSTYFNLTCNRTVYFQVLPKNDFNLYQSVHISKILPLTVGKTKNPYNLVTSRAIYGCNIQIVTNQNKDQPVFVTAKQILQTLSFVSSENYISTFVIFLRKQDILIQGNQQRDNEGYFFLQISVVLPADINTIQQQYQLVATSQIIAIAPLINLNERQYAYTQICYLTAEEQLSIYCAEITDEKNNQDVFQIKLPIEDLSIQSMTSSGSILYLLGTSHSQQIILRVDYFNQISDDHYEITQIYLNDTFHVEHIYTNPWLYGDTLFINTNKSLIIVNTYEEEIHFFNEIQYLTTDSNQKIYVEFILNYIYIVCSQQSGSTQQDWIAEYYINSLDDIQFIKFLPLYDHKISYDVNQTQFQTYELNKNFKLFILVELETKYQIFVYQQALSSLNCLLYSIPLDNINQILSISTATSEDYNMISMIYKINEKDSELQSKLFQVQSQVFAEVTQNQNYPIKINQAYLEQPFEYKVQSYFNASNYLVIKQLAILQNQFQEIDSFLNYTYQTKDQSTFVQFNSDQVLGQVRLYETSQKKTQNNQGAIIQQFQQVLPIQWSCYTLRNIEAYLPFEFQDVKAFLYSTMKGEIILRQYLLNEFNLTKQSNSINKEGVCKRVVNEPSIQVLMCPVLESVNNNGSIIQICQGFFYQKNFNQRFYLIRLIQFEITQKQYNHDLKVKFINSFFVNETRELQWWTIIPIPNTNNLYFIKDSFTTLQFYEFNSTYFNTSQKYTYSYNIQSQFNSFNLVNISNFINQNQKNQTNYANNYLLIGKNATKFFNNFIFYIHLTITQNTLELKQPQGLKLVQEKISNAQIVQNMYELQIIQNNFVSNQLELKAIIIQYSASSFVNIFTLVLENGQTDSERQCFLAKYDGYYVSRPSKYYEPTSSLFFQMLPTGTFKISPFILVRFNLSKPCTLEKPLFWSQIYNTYNYSDLFFPTQMDDELIISDGTPLKINDELIYQISNKIGAIFIENAFTMSNDYSQNLQSIKIIPTQTQASSSSHLLAW